MSLYERLGGEAALQAAVVLFYEKVMADPSVAPFFDGLDLDALIRKQLAFMTMAFGGPHHYTGHTLRISHARLVGKGLGDVHYDAMLQHLRSTLAELDIDKQAASEIVEFVEARRTEVLSR
jgi:hemoglobin